MSPRKSPCPCSSDSPRDDFREPMQHLLGTLGWLFVTQSNVGGARSGHKHGHFMGAAPAALGSILHCWRAFTTGDTERCKTTTNDEWGVWNAQCGVVAAESRLL